jgi:hypothetical protein
MTWPTIAHSIRRPPRRDQSAPCHLQHTEVDIVPDPQTNTLTIRLHPLANASSDLAVRHLCAELNATETLFPGTELRLIYDLVSSQNL